MTTPKVGSVFWKQHARRGWIRHEVRAIVDNQFVFRWWSSLRGWVYEAEPLVVWTNVWMRPHDTANPYVTTDKKLAGRLNDAWAKRAAAWK